MASNSNTYRWTTVIVLFIRATADGFEYPKRLTAAMRSEVDTAIGSQARVNRPALVEFLMPTGNGRSKFARSAPVTAGEMSALQKAADAGKLGKDERTTLAKGFVIPADSLGRNVKHPEWSPDHKTGESIRLWVKDRVAPTGLVDGFDVSIAVVPRKLVAKDDRP